MKDYHDRERAKTEESLDRALRRQAEQQTQRADEVAREMSVVEEEMSYNSHVLLMEESEEESSEEDLTFDESAGDDEPANDETSV